ncbi:MULTISPECIES: hypothetical protein [unclassified Duganella]|uniref:hypothetical protein n=1 Tax=unclassified Duganella TaxID=2636909 RepID=UPI000E34AEF4|nr:MULTISPECIES: hypothetical protein [unclassified Duganella]RFP19507.1 hypothetical protein D0T23_06975 [Duganella sp. BJB475]RFP36088.1 hypothetical protein D0T21_06520 [Duganella sp. BJB476]
MMCVRLLSVAFFGGLILALSVYPLHDSWLSAILLAYGALLWWRPVLWLLALPALLPVLDLAPHTGWFFLEEIDLLLLLTAGVCYWHFDTRGMRPVFPPLFRCSLWLLAGACCIALWRGLRPLPPIDANSFNNYLSPYNALRVGKAWFWSYVLLAPLKQALGPDLAGLRRFLIPGMLIGLLLASAAAIWERWQFPGLLNFSSDYRITAPFSAMHTGGAALDGYLAMSFPLLAAWLFGKHRPARQAAALLMLPLALYAGLATFSRGLYAAYALAAPILAGIPLMGALRAGSRRRRWRAPLIVVAAGALAACVLGVVFDSSGYRGFGAALALLTAALILSALPLRPLVLASSLICGTVVAGGLAWLLPVGEPPVAMLKSPYLLFLVSLAAFALAACRPHPLLPLAMLALAGLSVNAVWIAYHHAGAATLAPSAGLLLTAMSPLALNVLRRRPLWRLRRGSLTALMTCALVLATAIPVYNGYFVGERFASTGSDLSGRVRHWSNAIGMMDDDLGTVILGAGLGKFPSLYFWRNQQHEVPASYRYLDQDGNRFLRLSAGEYPAGYGELLRLLQIVPIESGTSYLLALDVWNGGAPAFLQVNLCERQLLYPQGCIPLPMRQLPHAPYWQRYQFPLSSGVLGQAGRRVQLEIAVEGEHAALDIDNVSLRNLDSLHELVRNGTFSDANNYWFFSSDRHHLPWHLKNLGLNLYFEMGWPGLLAYVGLLSSAAAELLRCARDGADAAQALALLAALAAFQVVGLFDSLFDVPRITVLFMLLLCAAALRPVPSIPPAVSTPC